MWSPKALSVLWMPRQSALMCYTLLIPWSGYASHRSMQCMCVIVKAHSIECCFNIHGS